MTKVVLQNKRKRTVFSINDARTNAYLWGEKNEIGPLVAGVSKLLLIGQVIIHCRLCWPLGLWHYSTLLL